MIDCHFHLDESLVSVKGLVQSMDKAGIDKLVLIPAVNPPFELPTTAKLGAPVLRKLLGARLKFCHCCGLAIYKSSIKDGVFDVTGEKYEVFPNPDNDATLEALKLFPERLLGMIFVNPAGTDPIREIDRCMNKSIVGIKAHPYWHEYKIESLMDTAAYCQEKELHMLIHLGADTKGDFKLLPKNFPDLKIIYAHAGVPYLNSVCEYAADQKNVFVDLAGSSYVDLKTARRAVKLAGPLKCIYGSDGPLFHSHEDSFDFSRFQDMLMGLELDRASWNRVTSHNMEEIIGLR